MTTHTRKDPPVLPGVHGPTQGGHTTGSFTSTQVRYRGVLTVWECPGVGDGEVYNYVFLFKEVCLNKKDCIGN